MDPWTHDYKMFEQAVPFGICISLNELNAINEILTEVGQGWSQYKVRSGKRFVESINPTNIPGHYGYLRNIVNKMLSIANDTITDGSKLVPIQLYLCLYTDGEDLCPGHRHSCRQLTVSLGTPRIMSVGPNEILLEHGSVIFLHGQKHGIPKMTSSGKRISLNLFFTTTSEMQGP